VLVVFINRCLGFCVVVTDIFGFASTSQAIGQEDHFLHQSAGRIVSNVTYDVLSGTWSPTVLYLSAMQC